MGPKPFAESSRSATANRKQSTVRGASRTAELFFCKFGLLNISEQARLEITLSKRAAWFADFLFSQKTMGSWNQAPLYRTGTDFSIRASMSRTFFFWCLKKCRLVKESNLPEYLPGTHQWSNNGGPRRMGQRPKMELVSRQSPSGIEAPSGPSHSLQR